MKPHDKPKLHVTQNEREFDDYDDILHHKLFVMVVDVVRYKKLRRIFAK